MIKLFMLSQLMITDVRCRFYV